MSNGELADGVTVSIIDVELGHNARTVKLFLEIDG